jgi:predicted Rossmann-fold nucleotide-binding protein
LAQQIKSICVFCGSMSGARPEYAAAARELGELLARQASALSMVADTSA